ncbi:MAG: SGNH/GDSL hydrolase family protein [Pseudomonadota bacterium]
MFFLKKVFVLTRQIIIITLISVLCLEAAFRIYQAIQPSYIFYDASYNRFRGKPNSYDYEFALNSSGFKDVEFKKQKESDVFRILGMGDSFAYGVVPYQYNYYTLLEDELSKLEQNVELINMGIINTGPKDYYALLVNEGLELKPDMVILSIFIGNDFIEPVRELYSYSYVASFIKFVSDLFHGGFLAHGRTVYQDDKPTHSTEVFMNIEVATSHAFLKNYENFKNHFDASLETLIKFAELCKENNIELLFFIIPDEAQVNEALQQEVMERFKEYPGGFDFAQPNRWLAEAFEADNIAYLDPLEPFKQATMLNTLYKPRDTHWNIAGNELAAALLYQHLSLHNNLSKLRPGP